MKINIAYLYPDYMNLYGEIGNIKAITHELENQEVKTNIDCLSINENIDFEKYDLFVMGCGTEKNRLLILTDLMSHKEELEKSFNENKHFLVTGNALALFGKSIEDNDNKVYETLNLFSFNEKYDVKRTVKEINITNKIVSNDIYGFINRQGSLFNESENLFDFFIKQNNFYGTTLLGPVLVRNPKLLEEFITNLIKIKDEDYELKPFDFTLEEKAYEEFILFKKDKK